MKDAKKVVRLLKQISNEFDSKDEHDALVGLAVAIKIIYSQGIYVDLSFGQFSFNTFTFGESGIGDLFANAYSSQRQSLNDR